MNNRKRSSSRQKKAPSTLTGEGAVFGLEPPPGGAAASRRGAKASTKMHGVKPTAGRRLSPEQLPVLCEKFFAYFFSKK